MVILFNVKVVKDIYLTSTSRLGAPLKHKKTIFGI
jgi:hypothetical protein